MRSVNFRDICKFCTFWLLQNCNFSIAAGHFIQKANIFILTFSIDLKRKIKNALGKLSRYLQILHFLAAAKLQLYYCSWTLHSKGKYLHFNLLYRFKTKNQKCAR